MKNILAKFIFHFPFQVIQGLGMARDVSQRVFGPLALKPVPPAGAIG